MFCLNARLRVENNFTHINYNYVNVQKMHFREHFDLDRHKISQFLRDCHDQCHILPQSVMINKRKGDWAIKGFSWFHYLVTITLSI